MKKLFTSAALCAFVLFQSCTKEELTPQQPIATAPVNIANVVAAMKENFILSGAKAILTTPADNDPSTNLTTLYMADAQGQIAPIIENFEVKDVRVTTNGIYVLTNYGTTAFFVKFDNSWLELKEVDEFKGEDDNGNLVFSTGAILNTQTLQLDRSQQLAQYDFVGSNSGNLDFIGEVNGRGIFTGARIRNHVTHVEHIVYGGPSINPYSSIAFFKGTDFALIPWVIGCQLIDLKTGKRTTQPLTRYFTLKFDVLRLDDGSIIEIEQASETDRNLKLAQLYVKQNNDGEVIPDRIIYSSVPVDPVSKFGKVLFGSDKYYMCREADKVKVFDKALVHKGDILNGLSDLSLSLVHSLVYYSGVDMNNKPVSGVYDLDTNQNTVLDTENLYSNIQPL